MDDYAHIADLCVSFPLQVSMEIQVAQVQRLRLQSSPNGLTPDLEGYFTQEK